MFMFVPKETNLLIYPLKNAPTVTEDSRDAFDAQGEWELLDINISRAETTNAFYNYDYDQLIYQV